MDILDNMQNTNPAPALVSKLVSNEIRYVPFHYKKSYKQRKTTAKAVVFMALHTLVDTFTKSATLLAVALHFCFCVAFSKGCCIKA